MRNEALFDDGSLSTDCVLDLVRNAIKSLLLPCPSPAEVFFELAGVTLLWTVEVVARDDAYEDEVELEKLRRRRFVFLFIDATGTSSSVSSSVVLFAFSKMFKRRLRGARLLLPAEFVVAWVVIDDDDSDLRFFIAKNRKIVIMQLGVRWHENKTHVLL